MDEDMKLLARADPAFQESLQSEVEPDPMEGEQTWPTDEEFRQAEGASRKYSITILGQTCFQPPSTVGNQTIVSCVTGSSTLHHRGFRENKIELLYIF